MADRIATGGGSDPLARVSMYAAYATRHGIKFNDGRGTEIEVGPAIAALVTAVQEVELAAEAWRVERDTAVDALREIATAAKNARSTAAAPDYDEEAIRDALWATVDIALAAVGGPTAP